MPKPEYVYNIQSFQVEESNILTMENFHSICEWEWGKRMYWYDGGDGEGDLTQDTQNFLVTLYGLFYRK